MANPHRTAFLIYLACFIAGLSLFFSGYRVSAYLILFSAWAILSVWLWHRHE
jgi:membrane protein implicated in regulation of membrane protease activity